MVAKAAHILLPSALQKIEEDLFRDKELEVYIKRDDLIHPLISGNKWRKLKYNIANAEKGILTFGGAFSNHIVATAIAAHHAGIRSIGIIRGERTHQLNPSLKIAEDHDMELHFISRSDYRKKDDADFLKDLEDQFPEFLIVPEGGSNESGIKGCSEIMDEIELKVDHIICAMGTGATVAGIARSLKTDQKLHAISVLKSAEYLEKEVEKMSPGTADRIVFHHDHHFGGYAKINDDLIKRMRQFYKEHQIKTDPVYSGKSLFALYDLIEKDHFKPGSRVLFYHCGGLQGIKGMEERYSFKLFEDQVY